MRKLLNEELGRPTVEEYAAQEKLPVVVVLDNVRSAQNVGSFFRTADAFGIGRIALCGISATPPNREIHKTALGAEDSVPWEYYEDTMDAVSKLKAEGYIVCSVEQAEGSVSLPDFKVQQGQRYALILGNEVKGVQQSVVDASDCCIEIPQFGIKHSFNVSVTTGIVLWELFRQMRF